MSPESSSAQRGARVATPGPRGGARLTGHEGWAAGWEFNIQGGIFFFKTRAAPGRMCSVGR
ncbi:rCG53706 [Rattus norvegicus]|uniref:RCG53706 n=1 Tax=Rattus norvegicus TaxID=10116 RepID=A6JB14_RAT|nr:rCG53706 [Rattus norvegicus]